MEGDQCLKKGDQVACTHAQKLRFSNNYGKIWSCQTDDGFTAKSGTQVVFLEGFSGYFSTVILQKVNLEFLRGEAL
ncbi:hypothetical protein [Brevibacillus laterosporus]|uniref:hypothetical protein n=1 Tax=Brevibacillus laterosporus TaxID=1465 RepID=UPI003D22DD1C